MYSKRHERDRQAKETPERILELARKNGEFNVSLRYRDEWLRRRCGELKRQGLLRGGKREGRAIVFYPVTPATQP